MLSIRDSGGNVLSSVDAYGDFSLSNKATFLNSGNNIRIVDKQSEHLWNDTNNHVIALTTTDGGAFKSEIYASSSVAIGNNLRIDAGAINSVVIGASSFSTAHEGVAIGNGAGSAVESVAIGDTARANNGQSVAIGRGATSAYRGFALGFNSDAANNATSIGTFSQATGNNSIALGYDNDATGQDGIAIGRSSNVGHNYSVAIGYQATTSSTNQIMLGTASEELNLYSYGDALFTSHAVSDVTMTLKGAASQSANLQEWQDSGGNVLSRVASDGSFYINNVNASSSLSVGGSITKAFTQKSADYTLTDLDYHIECIANTFTITLPTAVGISGREYSIKNSGSGIITVDGDGAETIDGAATQTLNQWDSIKIVSNGSNWLII